MSLIDIRKVYKLGGKQMETVKAILNKMHGIVSAKIGKRLYFFRKGFDIQEFAQESGERVKKIKGKKPFTKRSPVWEFKSRMLKKYQNKPYNLGLSEAMTRTNLEWRKEKKRLGIETPAKKYEKRGMPSKVRDGFDYKKLDVKNTGMLREILETKLKKKKNVEFRDVANVTQTSLWMYKIIPKILKYSEEILKDLKLNGRLEGTSLGRIDLV